MPHICVFNIVDMLYIEVIIPTPDFAVCALQEVSSSLACRSSCIRMYLYILRQLFCDVMNGEFFFSA